MNTETNQYTIANQKHYAIKPPNGIEIIATLTATIQEAARTTTTPEPTSRQTITIPQEILDKIRENRKARAKWQKYRTRENKKHLNKLAKEIKKQNKGAQQ